MSDEFLPDHPKSGFYFSDKGPMLAPHEEPPILSDAMGDSRHQTNAIRGHWDATTIVNTGLTRGRDKNVR